jgi:hypothetical protein
MSQAALLLTVLCLAATSAFSQSTATSGAQAGKKGPPRGPQQAPLFFRLDWKGAPGQPPLSQAYVPNPNLELGVYGAGNGMVISVGEGQTHVWTGLCERPCAAALRDKNNYVDLSGLGKIRWHVRVSGLHRVHPIIKLADGTWLVGERGDANEADMLESEFTLSESRWIKLDIDKVVTRGDWLEPRAVDFTKVDEVGFTDLMPGSGHGDGGFMDMGWIEVYGKPVPRGAAAHVTEAVTKSP